MKIEIPEVKVTNYQLWTRSKTGGCWYPVKTERRGRRKGWKNHHLPRTQYVVNGIQYDGVANAATALDCNHSTLIYRCRSKSEKFKDWHKKKHEE